jgi:peptide deformylase
VTEFDEDLEKLVRNMFETMYSAPGVGLAAVQVGVPKRLFVMDCSGGKDPSQRVALINRKSYALKAIRMAKRDVCRFRNLYSS